VSDLATRQAAFDDWVRGLHAQRRHGAHDRIGSLNYLDAAARTRAAGAIESGRSLSLSRPVAGGPNARHDGGVAFGIEHFSTDFGPPGFQMRTDRVELDCHGHVNTHIDALNHLSYFGAWPNGDPTDDPSGSGTLLDLARVGIFTRAVHADIPALRGVPFVSPDEPVTGTEIDRALKAAGVRFEPGDALLLDCGRDAFEAAHGDWGEAVPKPGAGVGAAEWLADNKPALLCWDMLDAIRATEVSGVVHRLHWAIGLVLVDNCDFGAARPVLRAAGRAVGALVVAPLLVDGATGGSVNPMLVI